MGGATSKRAKAQGQVRTLDDVISDIGVGWWQVQLLYILCVASMADAMEIGLLSFLGPCVEEEMGLSSTEESTITGVVFVGETIGAFFFGELADLKGRRYSYAISLVFMAVFGVATYFAGNYAEVLAFRGLVGFGVGGCCVPFDYLAEVAPPAWRGKACLCSSLWWGFGSVLTTGSAWLLLDAYGWRVLALVCAAPVVLAMLALATLHESPRWLLAQGREPEARAALMAGARLNGKDLGEFRLAPYTVKRHQADPREIFAPGLRRSTLQLALNWVAFGFSYYGIILYIAEILEDSDSSSTSSSSDYCSFDYEPIFISSLSEPMVIVLGFLIIDRSRRVTQYLSYFLAGLFIALMAYLSSTSTATLTALAFVARGAIDLAASTTWLVTPESYPTEVRASAHAVHFIAARLAAFFASYWIYSGLSDSLICTVIGLLCILAAVNSFLMQETSGVHLDDMQGTPRTSLHKQEPGGEAGRGSGGGKKVGGRGGKKASSVLGIPFLAPGSREEGNA